MTAKLDYRWHLRAVMAGRGMYATTDLRPLLAERGFHLSQSQVYRLVTERPERLNLRVLMALLDILDCAIEDLIEPVTDGEQPDEPLTRRPAEAESRFRSRPTRARVHQE
ncbi:helix-turn-helix domain-containing protein [Spongiactinospora sp. 9N601]|uniref:helix-turn-helix domain-containing protein n=1 Tax=Spongiactinospora sp. 9N601 TaxID=3375149 RepID=UPI0037B4F2B8